MILDFVFLFFSSFLYFIPCDFDGYKNLYYLSALIFVYQIYRLTLSYKKDKNNFFISPIFLSVLFTFLLQLGAFSNIFLYIMYGSYAICIQHIYIYKSVDVSFRRVGATTGHTRGVTHTHTRARTHTHTHIQRIMRSFRAV